MDAGDPYTCEASNLGERGALELESKAGVAPRSCCICSDKPRFGNIGLFGVVGLEKVSSLETRRAGSRNAGEGDRVGLGASDSDRGFEVGVRSPSSSVCANVEFAMVEATCCSAMGAVDVITHRCPYLSLAVQQSRRHLSRWTRAT